MSRLPRHLRILTSMGIRLALQPLWLQLLVSVPLYALLFGLIMHFRSYPPSESVGRSAIVAVIFGVAMSAFVAYQGRSTRKALVEAVAGLDNAQRSQAIAVITDGVVPGDPTVRHAAVRLGSAYLRGKSVDQLKRQERRGWITSAIFVALIHRRRGDAIQCLPDPVVPGTRACSWRSRLPLSILRGRRFQRNYARLAESLPSQ